MRSGETSRKTYGRREQPLSGGFYLGFYSMNCCADIVKANLEKLIFTYGVQKAYNYKSTLISVVAINFFVIKKNNLVTVCC